MHEQITDPYYRRLRKALKEAETYMRQSNFSEGAKGRWNKIVSRAKRLGCLK